MSTLSCLPDDVDRVASVYGATAAVKATDVSNEVGAGRTPVHHFASLAPAPVSRHKDVPARRTTPADPGEVDDIRSDPAPADSDPTPGRVERVNCARRIAGARGVVRPHVTGFLCRRKSRQRQSCQN